MRLELACNLLNAQPKPRNSKDFYLKLKKQYFDKSKKQMVKLSLSVKNQSESLLLKTWMTVDMQIPMDKGK